MKHKNLIIFLSILALDQVTKRLALAGKTLFQTNILSFNLVNNTGATFGILQGANQYLVWASVIALGLILKFAYDFEKSERTALTAVAAGITGNLVDRIAYGHVVDFIDFHFWPVFNFADCAIVIGVLYLVYRNVKG